MSQSTGRIDLVRRERVRGRSFVNAWRTALLALLIMTTPGTRADTPTLELSRAIPLKAIKGRIDHLSLDPAADRLWLAALGHGSVESLDLSGATPRAPLKGLRKPQGVCVIPESHHLIVASGRDEAVRIYDAEGTQLGEVKDLPDADNVRYDPRAKLAYVGYGDGALAVIDPEKAAKVGEIKLSGHPESFQLAQQDSRIFVNVPDAREIAVADREKRTVIASWPIKEGRDNYPMALDEAGQYAYIGCRSPARLLAVDLRTGETIGRVECCGDTDDLYFDAARKRVYVIGGAGCISVVDCGDTRQLRLIEKVSTRSGARTGLFDPQGRRLFVAVPSGLTHGAEIREYKAN